jgi:polar amino acid transport system substrate-binding protein
VITRTRPLAALAAAALTLSLISCSSPNTSTGSGADGVGSVGAVPSSGPSSSGATSPGPARSDSSSAGGVTGGAGTAVAGAVVQAAADLVPADVRERGTLVVATGEGYPPFEFYAEDNTTLQGVDPELITAVAGALGLTPDLQVLKFDGIIPGLQGGRYDIAAAAMGVTAERNKVVDFVTYFEGGSSIMTPAGNPQGLNLENLCGHRIAAQKGTIYADNYLPKFNADCVAKGQPEIIVDIYPDAAQTNLAVGNGRADGVVSDFGPLAYVAQQSNGRFSVLDQSYDPAPYGFALPKDSELAPAIEAAVEAVIADGTYGEILEKWDVATGAITDPTISRG